jgi:hypothetical protein
VSPPGPTGTPSTKSSAKPTGSASAAGSASASPSPSPSPSPAPVGSTNINVPVKAFGCVVLSTDSAQFLQITQLAKAVGSGMAVNMSFTFSQAGGNEYTIPTGTPMVAVPVDTPASAGSRAPAQVSGSGE